MWVWVLSYQQEMEYRKWGVDEENWERERGQAISSDGYPISLQPLLEWAEYIFKHHMTGGRADGDGPFALSPLPFLNSESYVGKRFKRHKRHVNIKNYEE